MDVYFTTLGGGERRWYSSVRQILPTPVIENNVVLYTGLFDINNEDNALLPEMTAQVYFITDSAQDVLTIPMGAVTFIERPEQGSDAQANNAATDGQSPVARPGGQQGQAAGLRANLGAAARNGEQSARRGPGLRRQGAQGRLQGPEADENSPRPALVSVVDEQGNQETRRVLIGVTSRITAEVIDGLEEGEQVVSGVIQRQRPAGAAADGGRPPGGFGRPF
jgi:macrolide-specific efflux system membrane fusion protein